MPVRVPDNLPAVKTLVGENIFVMPQKRALEQDIRPLKLVVLNLMPTKSITETQLLRLIGNTALQVDVALLRMASHQPKNTSMEYLEMFYKTFRQIEGERFDGMIITGAPVELMEFEAVTYWDELKLIMEWAESNVFSTMHICWAAQAALYYSYGIKKLPLDKKCFGVFPHRVMDRTEPITRGFDDVFYAPHSRHTEVLSEDIERVKELKLLAVSDEAGVYMAMSRDKKHVYVTGHSEYDADTLKREYERDIGKGLDICVPANYFPNDDPQRPPMVTWRAHANLLFNNWLNYHVYQETPYDLSKLSAFR